MCTRVPVCRPSEASQCAGGARGRGAGTIGVDDMSCRDISCRDMVTDPDRHAAGKRRPEDALPLGSAVFHVLLSLADGEKHGYAILKEVAARTDSRVELGTGTLYGIIKRLLADEMIRECPKRPAEDFDDQRRRYYRLTDRGREIAMAEAERLSKLLARARGKRLLDGWKPA